MKDTKIYKVKNDCLIKADVYYESKNTSAIIYLHGGALIWGTRTSIPEEQIDFYIKSGFNVVSLDYRLAPETKLMSIVEDVRDAISWVRAEGAKLYGIDPDKIGIVGSSAGGYLSLLSGTGIYGFRPKAIVSFCGYGDILGDWYTTPSNFYCQKPIIAADSAYDYVGHDEISEGANERFLFYLYCRQKGVWVNQVTGFDPINDKSELLAYNPISNINADYPPALLLHGTDDTDVPYEQSFIMNDMLKKRGIVSELITLYGAGHVFDRDFNNIEVKNAFERVVQFLSKYIG